MSLDNQSKLMGLERASRKRQQEDAVKYHPEAIEQQLDAQDADILRRTGIKRSGINRALARAKIMMNMPGVQVFPASK